MFKSSVLSLTAVGFGVVVAGCGGSKHAQVRTEPTPPPAAVASRPQAPPVSGGAGRRPRSGADHGIATTVSKGSARAGARPPRSGAVRIQCRPRRPAERAWRRPDRAASSRAVRSPRRQDQRARSGGAGDRRRLCGEARGAGFDRRAARALGDLRRAGADVCHHGHRRNRPGADLSRHSHPSQSARARLCRAVPDAAPLLPPGRPAARQPVPADDSERLSR